MNKVEILSRALESPLELVGHDMQYLLQEHFNEVDVGRICLIQSKCVDAINLIMDEINES